MSVTHRIRSCFDSCANSVLPHHEVLLQKQTSFWTDLTEPWKSIAERPVLIIGLDYGHQMFLVWIMAIKDSDGGNQSLTLHWLSADSSALGMMYFGSRIWHWRCHFAQVNATFAMGDTRTGYMLLYMLDVWSLIDPRNVVQTKRKYWCVVPAVLAEPELSWDCCRRNKMEAFCLRGGRGSGGQQECLVRWARS